MKLLVPFLALIFLISCGRHRDENQYDTNAAEVVDNPADLKRGDAETNEHAANAAPNRTGHPTEVIHPTDKQLKGEEKTKVPNSFAAKAADASEGEVALGEMAAQKTKSQKIVAFANMMMKDHKAANDELKRIASEKGIELPAQCLSCEANYKDLHNLSTAAFERKYAEQMVMDHQNAVDLFTKASQEEQDPDLKKWATEKLPVLKHHLAMAKELAKEEGVSAKKQKPNAAPRKSSAGKKRDRKTIRS